MKIKISKEFITYCLVGLINTLVGFSTAFISLNVFLLNYAISTGLAYITGNIASFYLNKKFTFKNKGKSGKQFIVFFLSMLPAYVISYWLGYKLGHLSENYLSDIYNLLNKITNIPKYRLADNFAVLLSMAIYLFAGFSINKFLVFKKHK